MIAVEGYVDVISLSVAGFPHAVAPLGTALTEDQLALLWRMADEPILCFDGDKAGRRAAYRALDVGPAEPAGRQVAALRAPAGRPGPGRPRPRRRRAGGRAGAGLGAAPRRHPVGAGDSRPGRLDTPERRAALERRLREALAAIRDDTLKRYYREEVEARLSALGPEPRGGRFARGGRRPARPGGSGAAAGAAPGARSAPARSSPAARCSSAGRPRRPREAMILCAFLVHPELLHAHAETLAELDLEGRSAQAPAGLLLDGAASGEAPDPAVLQARLERAGLAEAAARLQALVRPGDRWVLDPHADPVRLEDALRQAITLHRRARTLHSELRAAERALAEEDNEANLAWLREVQNQLSSMEGAEADLDDSVVHRDP